MDSYTIRCLLDCPNCSLLDFTLEDNFLQNKILLCSSHMVGLVIGNCSLLPAVSSPAAAEEPATGIHDVPLPAASDDAGEPVEPAPAAAEEPVPAAPASATPTPAAADAADESTTGLCIPTCAAPAAPAAAEVPAPAAAEVPAPAAAAETLAVNRKRKREESVTATKRKFKRKRRTDTNTEHDKLMVVYKTLLQKQKAGFLDIAIHKKTEIKKLYGHSAFYAYRPIVELSIADPETYKAALASKGEDNLSTFADYCKELLTSMPNLKELRNSGVLLS